MVSNDYPTAGTTYTVDAQTFTIHLKHGTQAVTGEETVNETIHYVYADGTSAAADYVATPYTFKRTGTKDLVTGITTWNAWSASRTFAAVESPLIDGYTADQKTVAAVTVNAEDADVEKTVTYTANTQSGQLVFIDDDSTSGDGIIQTINVTGKYGDTIDFSQDGTTVAEMVAAYEAAGYDLVSQSYQGGETY